MSEERPAEPSTTHNESSSEQNQKPSDNVTGKGAGSMVRKGLRSSMRKVAELLPTNKKLSKAIDEIAEMRKTEETREEERQKMEETIAMKDGIIKELEKEACEKRKEMEQEMTEMRKMKDGDIGKLKEELKAKDQTIAEMRKAEETREEERQKREETIAMKDGIIKELEKEALKACEKRKEMEEEMTEMRKMRAGDIGKLKEELKAKDETIAVMRKTECRRKEDEERRKEDEERRKEDEERSRKSRKVVIKITEMNEGMQQFAIHCATQALEKYNDDYWKIAEYIRDEFDKKYNGYWHCIVNRNHPGYNVSYDLNHYIFFSMGEVSILLFKS